MVYAKKADFKQIASEYGIDQVLARIIRNRDICGSKDIDMYLNGNLNDIHNPHSMKDADKFVDIITKKIEEHKPVRIIGDYDIDGICSIYILFCGLKAAGADVDYVVPHRINDGYGINGHLIDNAINEGIDTIVTCDNGIAAYNQVRYAKDNGITMIVTDHHDVPFEIKDDKKVYIVPPADAVINPKQADCDYPFKLLCGAGVAYKLISLLYDRLGLDKKELEDYIEFMAIATVGDIVDLIDENRIVVKYGLKHIAHTKNTGLRALIEECQLDINNISSYHIGFVIGPCLNASGRLDTARQAIELMLCKDNEKAHNMAKELIALNNERKSMTEQETQKAIELVENTGLLKDRVLVIYLKDCHESIAGIIAGRIKERYYRPTFVITNAEDGAKGSGRSIEGYNMYEEINKCKNVLTKYGGHPMAAGLSLAISDIDIFRKMLNDNAILTDEDLIPKMWIDVPMPVSYANIRLVNQLKLLEPFGKGNEKPVFADRNLYVKTASVIGKNKNVLRCQLETEDGTYVHAVQFGINNIDDIPRAGMRISIIYYPDINTFNGIMSLQIIIKEWKETI
ncbi:MAG TPA: single-stranded-DNA-specific exonuclease RecJ [Eubacterium sp.]|nr:single-stranded-DNA-specific exonuclease RecJ [Eubacterium sp.]HCW37540.1 single-stranded-DNA-specific exonuclease RecJ [Eubacterium sp.]